MRLSALTAKAYGISRRTAKDYIRDGKVKIDGRIVRQDVEVDESAQPELVVEQRKTHYNLSDYLLKEYENVVFFYKPSFMHTERHRPEDKLCLSDIISEDFPDFELKSRLDYSVDGVVPAVKKGAAIRQMQKTYIAVVSGCLTEEIYMDNKIDAAKRKSVKVLEESGGNKTHIKPLKSSDDFTLVCVTLEKAARHQVRAFLSHIGHPILGDTQYGGIEHQRIMLHCSECSVNNQSSNSGHEKHFLELI